MLVFLFFDVFFFFTSTSPAFKPSYFSVYARIFVVAVCHNNKGCGVRSTRKMEEEEVREGKKVVRDRPLISRANLHNTEKEYCSVYSIFVAKFSLENDFNGV